MGEAYFYHLTDSPLEVTLPVLLEKSLANGWRVLVRGTDAERLRWLEDRLWQGPEDGFLPHGLDGGPFDADQPVLLSQGSVNLNTADCVMAVDGAAVTVTEIAALSRVCILFDGNDPDAVSMARGQWKDLTGAGAKAVYWAESDGRWTKKAESGA